jgi:hypothetical protein
LFTSDWTIEEESGDYALPAGTSKESLVGMPASQVKMIIKENNPQYEVVIILDGSSETREINYDRIKVYRDEDGNCVSVPIIG